jgi:hypothetical protein
VKKCTVEIEDDDFTRLKDGKTIKTKLDGVSVVIVSADEYFKLSKDDEKTAAEEKADERDAAAKKEELATLLKEHKYDPDFILIRSHVKLLVKQDETVITTDAMETLDTATRLVISEAINIAKETAKKLSEADPKKRVRQIIVPVTIGDAMAKVGAKK